MKGFRWKLRRRRSGDSRITTARLRPDPVLREVTYDLFERVCVTLGIDADAMFRGAVSILDIETPKLSSAERVFELIVENAHRFDLRGMPPDRVDALLGVVLADFFLLVLQPGTRSGVIESF